MINQVWLFLIGFGITVALGNGKTAMVSEVIFANSGKAIEFTIGLAGVIAFWSGILKIAETAGLTDMVAGWFRPLMNRLFPGLKRHKGILGLISMTFAANMLGLGNLATPLGLKTMTELQKINPEKERASDEICTFICLILGGFSMIPTTLIALRSQAGSANPTSVVGPVLVITFCGTLMALVVNFMALKTSARRRKRQ